MTLKMMKGHSFYFFYLILMMFVATNNVADASRLSQSQKTILKTIKSEDGDVVDCVHIYHQPAFDHPLLRDHKIKLKPSNYPQGFLLDNNSAAVNITKQITQVWQLSGECPNGTVPIKRTDGRKNTSFKKSSYVAGPDDFSNGNGHEYAIYRLGQDKYYGAKAVISALNPSVERDDEFSLSQLWLVAGSGSGSDLETIEVGWQVYPSHYQNRLTRLFVFWTNDNYGKSGCYNLECPGFVQTSNQMLIGGSITNPGEITLLVWKDESREVWWLNYNDITVGYWPFSLFRLLQDSSASRVDFGGEIINFNTNGVHTATQMGSGEFAEAGKAKASHFRNIEIVNGANAFAPPNGHIQVSNANCYDIAADKNDEWGNFFYYGGPGRNPKCP